MHKTDKINDADLHAYVDGELDEQRTLEVEIYLREHPEKARDVAVWQQQNETLQALYNTIIDEPVPSRLDPHQIAANNGKSTKSKNQWFGWQSMAAMFALFTIGVTSGWLGHGAITKTPHSPAQQLLAAHRPMVRHALVAHTTYAVEVLHPVDVSGENEQHLVSWLSKRLEVSIKAPKLTKQGFTLVGGRLLPRDEGIAAQFMYEDAHGSRITLYVIRNQKPETSSFRFASYKKMNAFYWLDHKISYVLVGNVTKQELSPLAHNIYSQLEN